MLSPTTLVKLFLDRSATQPNRPAVHFRHGKEYQFRTWAQLADDGVDVVPKRCFRKVIAAS